MIDNLDINLTGIAIGVRFRANFAIEDELGSIVDKIVYKKGSLVSQRYSNRFNWLSPSMISVS